MLKIRTFGATSYDGSSGSNIFGDLDKEVDAFLSTHRVEKIMVNESMTNGEPIHSVTVVYKVD